MNYLRVLRRRGYSCWPRPEDDPAEPHPEVVQDFVGRDLSFFAVDSQRDIDTMVLGFSCGRARPDHLNYVLIPAEVLQSEGLEALPAPDRCHLPFRKVKEAHREVKEVTEDTARRILSALATLSVAPVQVRQRDLRGLAARAYHEGWPEIEAEEWCKVPRWLLDDPDRR